MQQSWRSPLLQPRQHRSWPWRTRWTPPCGCSSGMRSCSKMPKMMRTWRPHSVWNPGRRTRAFKFFTLKLLRSLISRLRHWSRPRFCCATRWTRRSTRSRSGLRSRTTSPRTWLCSSLSKKACNQWQTARSTPLGSIFFGSPTWSKSRQSWRRPTSRTLDSPPSRPLNRHRPPWLRPRLPTNGCKIRASFGWRTTPLTSQTPRSGQKGSRPSWSKAFFAPSMLIPRTTASAQLSWTGSTSPSWTSSTWVRMPFLQSSLMRCLTSRCNCSRAVRAPLAPVTSLRAWTTWMGMPTTWRWSFGPSNATRASSACTQEFGRRWPGSTSQISWGPWSAVLTPWVRMMTLLTQSSTQMRRWQTRPCLVCDQITNTSSTPSGPMMASLCGSDQHGHGPFQPLSTSMATGTASNTCGLHGTRCRSPSKATVAGRRDQAAGGLLHEGSRVGCSIHPWWVGGALQGDGQVHGDQGLHDQDSHTGDGASHLHLCTAARRHCASGQSVMRGSRSLCQPLLSNLRSMRPSPRICPLMPWWTSRWTGAATLSTGGLRRWPLKRQFPSTASWSSRMRRSGTSVVPWSPVPLVGTRPTHFAVPTIDSGKCVGGTQQGLHQEALCQGQACILGQSGMWPHPPIPLIMGSGDEAEGGHNWRLHVQVLQGLLEARTWWVPLPADHWQAQVQGGRFSWWSTNRPRTYTTSGPKTAWSTTRGWSR